MVQFKFDYDEEADDLFLYSNTKSKGSIEMGSLVLDFDNKGAVVGIELLNATKFLKDSVSDDVQRITKFFLSELIDCKVETKQENNFLFIKITLVGKNTTISCPINAPLIEETSPALAYT